MTLEDFITRWTGKEGGQERANYALFLTELCDVLEVPRPDPADATSENNDYAFERVVKETGREGSTSAKRIDLYRRNSFVLEAKQSRQEGGAKAVQGQGRLFEPEPDKVGKRTASKAWDVLMLNARSQAENYVRLLPANHAAPPFVIVCDVGHCFEIYANFRRDGKAYDQFPDRQGFRIYLEDLRNKDVRERLRTIWLDPQSLDPSTKSAKVTREIAERLAKVSRSLEGKKGESSAHAAKDVAMFLMRCLFTMFAEDVGLLPEASFKRVLEDCEKAPQTFVPVVGQLWEAMDKGEFAHALKQKVKRFNGEFFANPVVLPLSSEAIYELRIAAGYDWREVEPAIFGTLVEQALDVEERKALGAHYTPRAYVERLVHATIIDPLRTQWDSVQNTVEKLRATGQRKDAERAINAVKDFHDELTHLRVLDPACGTGNFLYVALELLKRLEGEVLEVLANLGGQEALTGLSGSTVDPHQFLGLELNPRAASIAELVLWIGYLQWFFRTSKNEPPEPILHAFRNIEVRDAVLTPDRKKRPVWPEADFIVGNPPFIGKGAFMRSALGDEYTEALFAVHKLNESADFVMYWWDRAAEILARKGTRLRRFGLVTTNSISQVFNRRVMEKHLSAKKPVSLVMAIADHPWTKATKDSAAVRIAMTVAQYGKHEGTLHEVTREAGLDSDAPTIEMKAKRGKINSDLTIGADVTSCIALKSNHNLASMGPALGGRGFVIPRSGLNALGLDEGSEFIRKLTTGRDIVGRHRDRFVIFAQHIESEEQLRQSAPTLYQYLKTSVLPERISNKDKNLVVFWWKYRRNNDVYFGAVGGLKRYIATVETTKHRVFSFVDRSELLEHGVVGFGLDDAFYLGVLASRIHARVWTPANAASLGVYIGDVRYSKSRCFDPFPFPEATEAQKAAIRAPAEELDALRKRVLAQHPHLTLTGLYNVLERVKAGAGRDDLSPEERRTFDDGLILILKELHETIDAAVADAYGWPADLAEEEILARLVALNATRAKEEARGKVKWLRPEYQIPRFGSPKEKAQLEADLSGSAIGQEAAGPKPSFPDDDVAQSVLVMSALALSPTPLRPADLAQRFRQGLKVERKVGDILEAAYRLAQVSRTPQGYAMNRAA